MNSRKKRNTLTWVVGLITLLVINGLVLQKEWQIRNGKTVRLLLSPIDPRSRLQGDYMSLRYDIPDVILQDSTLPSRGRLLVKLDQDLVGEFVGLEGSETSNESDLVAIKYKKTRSGLSMGAETFFFQEGQAETYEQSAYAELKVDRIGTPILVALLDSSMNRLEPPADLP